MPLSKRAKAKMVLVIRAMVKDNKSWILKRSMSYTELLFKREALAVIRMALLIKRVNIKRVITSLTIK